MHVLQAIDSLHAGGAEISLLDIIPALSARGVRTSIVTLLEDDGALQDRLQALGLAPTRLSQFGSIGKIFSLRDVVRASKPDLLHTTLWQSTLTGRLAARIASTPVVTTLANSDYGPEHRANSEYGPWSVRALQAADLVSARLTTRFHAVSAEVAETMSRRLRIPADRMQVVYRGRDPSRLGRPSVERRLRVRAELGLKPDVPVLLNVGRIARQKAVETSVEAFRIVRRRLPDAVLLIAGRPGNASGTVADTVAGDPGVRLLGHRSDIPDLMCAADVLSFPSRWEGYGGILIEAMALRLPVVASDIAPIAETIGSVGWPLVPRDDPAALATELISMLDGGASVEARKDAGQRRFSAAFTLDAAADGMIDLYRRALGDARTKRRIARRLA